MLTVNSPAPSFSAEAWIATALLGERDPAEILPDVEYEQIGEAAIENGVAALLHHCLSRYPSWSEFSPAFRESLAQPTRQNVALHLLRERDLSQVLEQFTDAGIEYLLIKGAGLAYTHYEQPYLRDRCDTDILFPDLAGFEQAWVILKNLGYQRKNTLDGEHVGFQHCCYRPLGSGLQQILDCHIKINDYAFFADALNFSELFEHAVPVLELAPGARTLGPVHALLLACMHRVATMPLGNADRLIWLFDIQLLSQSFTERQWGEFAALAFERNICGSCINSIQAAKQFFPLAVPPDVETQLVRVAAEEPFKPGQNMKRWQYYQEVFKEVDGWRGKARLLREHFVPSPDYMMTKYQPKSRLALPYLYIHRVFSGLKKYF